MQPNRVRRTANLLNGSTLLGLLLARLGRAHVEPGPGDLRLAFGYRSPVPAPNAPAVTVGDVVLLRIDRADLATRPGLLAHEGRHAVQWAWWAGPLGFLPAYLLASLWSWLLVGDFATRNPFEVQAGLGDGGYELSR